MHKNFHNKRLKKKKPLLLFSELIITCIDLYASLSVVKMK